MRQRRGMNFMGISYMGWRKKGKGFFMGEGLRDEGIRGLRKFSDPKRSVLAPSDLHPLILKCRSATG